MIEENYPGERIDAVRLMLYQFIDGEFDKLDKELDAMVPEPPVRQKTMAEMQAERLRNMSLRELHKYTWTDQTASWRISPQPSLLDQLAEIICPRF